jgi:hypothetical protein
MCPELCCLWVKFGFIIDFCNGILWFFRFEIWGLRAKEKIPLFMILVHYQYMI